MIGPKSFHELIYRRTIYDFYRSVDWRCHSLTRFSRMLLKPEPKYIIATPIGTEAWNTQGIDQNSTHASRDRPSDQKRRRRCRLHRGPSRPVVEDLPQLLFSAISARCTLPYLRSLVVGFPCKVCALMSPLRWRHVSTMYLLKSLVAAPLLLINASPPRIYDKHSWNFVDVSKWWCSTGHHATASCRIGGD